MNGMESKEILYLLRMFIYQACVLYSDLCFILIYSFCRLMISGRRIILIGNFKQKDPYSRQESIELHTKVWPICTVICLTMPVFTESQPNF
jgi:hypothetical protein